MIVSICIDNVLLKMVVLTETCEGWGIKKHSFCQSQWTVVRILYIKTDLLDTCFMLVSCLAYSSTLKMEATCSSETSVDFQRTTVRCIPEDKLFIITTVRTSDPTRKYGDLALQVSGVSNLRQ
jgi:hypothetical protein